VYTLIGQEPMFYQSVLLFCTHEIYIIKQMKKPKPCIALYKKNTSDIWEHSGNVENTRLRLVFSTFSSCSQMPIVFHHSVIHGLGFFICSVFFFVCNHSIKLTNK